MCSKKKLCGVDYVRQRAARSEGNDPSHLELGSRTFDPALGEDNPGTVVFWSWRLYW